ncbi:MAG: hypothetical protein AB8F78_01620 [Saprospiraceae bacterium]
MVITISKNIEKSELPQAGDILEKLKTSSGKLTITFESGSVDEDYRKELQSTLSCYHVSNARYISTIRINPAIETGSIQKILDDIHLAAISFKEDGVKLMEILGNTYEINPFDLKAIGKLKSKSRVNRQRGAVNQDWNFWFHGAECQFENRRTGQIVEIVVDYCPEYGALDSFFFLRYIDTTPAFIKLSEFFAGDWKSLSKALDMLEERGNLRRIDMDLPRGIVAI